MKPAQAAELRSRLNALYWDTERIELRLARTITACRAMRLEIKALQHVKGVGSD